MVICTMEKKILTVEPSAVSLDTILSDLHMSREHKSYGKVAALHEAALKIVKPVALYAAFTPEERDGAIWLNGVKFEEPFVYEMLSGCDIVIPYVASCGWEIDEWSFAFTDLFEQFAADVIKESCVDAVLDQLNREAREKYFNAGTSPSSINPGSLEAWPITGQRPLFEILGGASGVAEDIGVTLKDSLMMIPTKSVSGILFPSDTPYHNCQLCQKENCPERTAPYEG